MTADLLLDTLIDRLAEVPADPAAEVRALGAAVPEGDGWRITLESGPFSTVRAEPQTFGDLTTLRLTFETDHADLRLGDMTADPDAWTAAPPYPDSGQGGATRLWEWPGAPVTVSCSVDMAGTAVDPEVPVRHIVCFVTPVD